MGERYLDEIGDMQLKLKPDYCALSNGEFYRVSREPIQVDVRIITATHQNIEDLVKEGSLEKIFFIDLCY